MTVYGLTLRGGGLLMELNQVSIKSCHHIN